MNKVFYGFHFATVTYTLRNQYFILSGGISAARRICLCCGDREKQTGPPTSKAQMLNFHPVTELWNLQSTYFARWHTSSSSRRRRTCASQESTMSFHSPRTQQPYTNICANLPGNMKVVYPFHRKFPWHRFRYSTTRMQCGRAAIFRQYPRGQPISQKTFDHAIARPRVSRMDWLTAWALCV